MPVSSLVTGAVAGLGATIPMTLAMEVMNRSLPQHERYPLPPGIYRAASGDFRKPRAHP